MPRSAPYAPKRAVGTQNESVVRLAIVAGEGVGPEVTQSALAVMEAAARIADLPFEVTIAKPVMTRDDWGLCLNDTIRSFYSDAFNAGIPVLHGPMGGQYVYQLRREWDLPLKYTPVVPMAELANAAVVRNSALGDVDIVVIRDNSEGLYQGAFGWNDARTEAFHEARYSVAATERVVAAAVNAAQARSGKLAVVVKPGGVPAISALWREVTQRLVPGGVEVEFIEVDNACFQLVANPHRFDVIVAPNLFGDIISDTATTLLGSRGLSYSANFGDHDGAVFQTAHGAAHDLAGTNTANPIAHILSAAWAASWSTGRSDVADSVASAVARVVGAGLRTADIAAVDSRIVSTTQMTHAIVSELEQGQ